MALDPHGALLKMGVIVSPHHLTGSLCWSWLSWFICLSTRKWPQASPAPPPPLAPGQPWRAAGTLAAAWPPGALRWGGAERRRARHGAGVAPLPGPALPPAWALAAAPSGPGQRRPPHAVVAGPRVARRPGGQAEAPARAPRPGCDTPLTPCGGARAPAPGLARPAGPPVRVCDDHVARPSGAMVRRPGPPGGPR